jgi:hypothetical protein
MDPDGQAVWRARVELWQAIRARRQQLKELKHDAHGLTAPPGELLLPIRLRSTPSTITSPAVARSIPVIMFKIVVLWGRPPPPFHPAVSPDRHLARLRTPASREPECKVAWNRPETVRGVFKTARRYGSPPTAVPSPGEV